MTTINQKIAAVTGALILATTPSLSSAEGWELRTTPNAVPGTAEIESGEIEKGISISTNWLPHATPRDKVAVLNNLCIGYVLSRDFESAEEYCDQAVDRQNYESVSFNNRGVLKAMQGDYEKAAEDFAKATGMSCQGDCSDSDSPNGQQPQAVAMRNFDRAQLQVDSSETASDDQLAARSD